MARTAERQTYIVAGEPVAPPPRATKNAKKRVPSTKSPPLAAKRMDPVKASLRAGSRTTEPAKKDPHEHLLRSFARKCGLRYSIRVNSRGYCVKVGTKSAQARTANEAKARLVRKLGLR